MGFAIVQIVVHMIYFLHMNTRSEGGWTMLALIFTIVLVVITLSGSIWVMNHLNSQHDADVAERHAARCRDGGPLDAVARADARDLQLGIT